MIFYPLMKRKSFLRFYFLPKVSTFHLYKMATRSQKRKAVAELATGELETPSVENNQSEKLIAGPSKSPSV